MLHAPRVRRRAIAQDVDLLLNVADNMMGNTICVLADAAAMPVQSFLHQVPRRVRGARRRRRLPAHATPAATAAAAAHA